MIKFKTSLNFLLTNFIIFLICSVWTNFYIKNKFLAFFAGIILTGIIYFFLHWFLLKKHKTEQIKKINQTNLTQFKNYVNGLTDDEFKTLVQKMFNEKIEETSSYIIFNKNTLIINAIRKNLTQNYILMFCKTAKNLNLSKIAIFNFEDNEKIILFSKTIANFEIEFVSINKFFEIFENNNLGYENIIKFKNKTKINLKLLLSLVFARKNAKIFLLFGILNYFSSFLTIFKLYYYISTTLFLAFSLICLFRPKESSICSLIF